MCFRLNFCFLLFCNYQYYFLTSLSSYYCLQKTDALSYFIDDEAVEPGRNGRFADSAESDSGTSLCSFVAPEGHVSSESDFEE